jgi:multimeric flavodoxin WrbA
MNVVLVNGSPNLHGCTFTALKTVAAVLNEENVETQIFQIGIIPMSGCIGCLGCAETARCTFDDRVNEFLDLAEQADGFVFGSPVHYASITGAWKKTSAQSMSNSLRKNSRNSTWQSQK